MKRRWICLQLRFDAPQDVKLEMLSRRAALNGIAIIATLSLYRLCTFTVLELIKGRRRRQCMQCQLGSTGTELLSSLHNFVTIELIYATNFQLPSASLPHKM